MLVLKEVEAFRDHITDTIREVKDYSDLQSILDGLVDLQEEIDQFVYRFKLD